MVVSVWGEREWIMGNYCFMNTEFLFCKIKNSSGVNGGDDSTM